MRVRANGAWQDEHPMGVEFLGARIPVLHLACCTDLGDLAVLNQYRRRLG